MTTRSNTIVYLIDDDASVRRALERLIKSAGYRVEAFDSAHSFLASQRAKDECACIVLDVQLPGISGLDLQRELVAAHGLLPIIFITGHGDIPMSVRAMKDGAVDFLPKPVQADQLLHAIESALARAKIANAEHDEQAHAQRCFQSLTPREREVMTLVTQGRLNKQIAQELGTVEKTIKVHRARVMKKMKADSLADLVRLAERLGLHAITSESP